MKKVYLGLFTLVIAGSASAQLMNKNLRSAQKIQNIGEVPAKATHHYEKALPFWTNDFSTPSEWVISNAGASGSPAHTVGDWVITTDPTDIPITALNPAEHTTAANGYALIDSDAAVHSVELLELMSTCLGIVTANSTFSWWAAYIGELNGNVKSVVLPEIFTLLENDPGKCLRVPGWKIIPIIKEETQ